MIIITRKLILDPDSGKRRWVKKGKDTYDYRDYQI